MAEPATGTSPANDKGVPVHTADEAVGDLQLPSGWMYKSWGSGRWRTPWYASPRFQLGMVAFVCFMCPGMFNALGGLGGGGKADPKLADQMVSIVGLRLGGDEDREVKLINIARTSPCTVSSLWSVSSRVPSSTGSASDCRSPSAELDIASMRSVCSCRCTSTCPDSTSLPVLYSVPVPVFCGRLREPS